jgi:hypothetical protein
MGQGTRWLSCHTSITTAALRSKFRTFLLVMLCLIFFLFFAHCVFLQLYRILERHLTSTGLALVAVQRGSERAGVSACDKAALFEHSHLPCPPSQGEAQGEGAAAERGGATTVVRVAKRAIM